MPISLNQTYGPDAEEIKGYLLLFSSPGKRDAEIVNIGHRATGEELKAEGMARAEEHANEVCHEWSESALEAVKKFIKHHTGAFKAEDVRAWAKFVPPAPSLRAWGSVFLKAARAGLIKQVGYAKVDNPLAHSTPVNLWVAA